MLTRFTPEVKNRGKHLQINIHMTTKISYLKAFVAVVYYSIIIYKFLFVGNDLKYMKMKVWFSFFDISPRYFMRVFPGVSIRCQQSKHDLVESAWRLMFAMMMMMLRRRCIFVLLHCILLQVCVQEGVTVTVMKCWWRNNPPTLHTYGNPEEEVGLLFKVDSSALSGLLWSPCDSNAYGSAHFFFFFFFSPTKTSVVQM